ncbi:uncharacterized protein LOC132488699 isoform X3 [Mesoplodon densirostris]|nr:uncharacterized protein LOC132488699 isoform X3 [Mesoplodon densirostris]
MADTVATILLQHIIPRFGLPVSIQSDNGPTFVSQVVQQPGDSVLLKELHPQSLKPRWTGPHTVILTTPMAAKLLGHPSWYHVSRLKMAPTPETWTALPLGPTRLRLVRHPVSPPAPPPATQDSPDFPMALPCPRDMAS